MKKIIALGVVTAGSMGFSAHGQEGKAWSVSATLRGFWDDNYATAPSNPAPGVAAPRSSWGTELSPSASYNLTLDQTSIGLGYIYSMKYYEDRVTDSADHSHQASLSLKHNFSERYRLELSDSFVIAQESQLLDTTGPITLPLRSDGNNIRNTARLRFETDIGETFGLNFEYSNTIYDYEQTGAGSRSALLDRVEHLGTIDFLWKMQEDTDLIFGYQFGMSDQTSNDSLTVAPVTPASIRDRLSHFIYVGARHSFSDRLTGQIKAGGEFTEYPNAPAGVPNDDASPYVDGNLSYQYAQGSLISAGIKHQRAQTDIVALAAGVPTLDQELTTFYMSWDHKITGKLTSSVFAQFQNTDFNQGAANGQGEQVYVLGLNLAYEINQYLVAEAGYNYDNLDSDIANRSFSRNRVYLGIRATY